MHDRLPKHEIVLLGAGHTNSHVLRLWRMKRRSDSLLRDSRLTCISDFPVAAYSGMLPGVLAGQYDPERMEIDLARLCVSVNARLVLGEVTGLSLERRELEFASRPPLVFDCLSVGIGSRPDCTPLVDGDQSVTPIKPMQTFLSRLEARVRSASSQHADPLRVAVVGGGAGGVEITFCLPNRLQQWLDGREYEIKLLNMGDGRAIGDYRGIVLRGGSMWRLKDGIDGRFMDKHQQYEPMQMAADSDNGEEAMRCVGCGGKVGASVLDRALRRLPVGSASQVELGLDAPDDVALVRFAGDGLVGATVDFFAAPLDDAYLTGRIAALNSASDVFASGGSPRFALAAATVPLGSPRRQEQLMYEVLAGGVEELQRMGASLVGGHTIEGPRLTIGYTLLADYPDGPPRPKSGLRAGDVLVITKPLGSGVLLAAHMQARCKGLWFEELLTAMLQSNQQAAELYDEFDICGVTDITGFGLAGHLLEMLNASQTAAEIQLSEIPLLRGAEELFAEGLESTMAPANRAVESMIRVSEQLRNTPRYAALFDPQTSGGLLMGVAESRLTSLLEKLRQLSYAADVLGRVVSRDEDARVLHLLGS